MNFFQVWRSSARAENNGEIVLVWFIFVLYTLLSLSGNLGHLTWVRLQQPQEQRYPVLQVHAGSFRVSVINQTLAWTTRSLTCARDNFCAYIYIHRWVGHTDKSAQHFWLWKTLTIFLMLLTGPGFEPRFFGFGFGHSTNWATPWQDYSSWGSMYMYISMCAVFPWHSMRPVCLTVVLNLTPDEQTHCRHDYACALEFLLFKLAFGFRSRSPPPLPALFWIYILYVQFKYPSNQFSDHFYQMENVMW